MRALVLGGTGMLGHKVYEVFKKRYETYATVRRPASQLSKLPLFDEPHRLIGDVDVLDPASVANVIRDVQPAVIVNCIGVIKQLDEASDTVRLISLNSMFPHQLASTSREVGARLLHVSTDCVFSGRRGQYTEADLADPPDLYGQSKLLGEVRDGNSLTLRTSVIGRDFLKQAGLLEWFLSQRGKSVKGYVNSIYSGLPTRVLAEIMATVVEKFPALRGLYQVASEPITKYDLLLGIRNAMKLDIQIDAFDNPRCDRSLDGRRFMEATGIRIPSWEQMIAGIAGDPTPYDEWRLALQAR